MANLACSFSAPSFWPDIILISIELIDRGSRNEINDTFFLQGVVMVRNLLASFAIGFFAIGMVCSLGCNKPGPVIQGNATNADFGVSGETDEQGRKAPEGLGLVG